MSRIAAKGTGNTLDHTLERVRRGERVVLRRGNKPVAAVVSIADLRRLQRLEDKADVDESRRRLADPGEKRISYRTIRRRAGL